MNKSASQADTLENVIRLEITHPLKINLVDEKGNPLKLTPEKKGKDEDKKSIKPTERLAKFWNLIWSDIPFRITLVVLGVLLGVSFTIAAILWLRYSQTCVSDLEHSSVGVDVAIKYCPWLTVGEENSVEITLVNKKNVQLEKVKAYLVFNNALPVGTVADGSNTASFGDMAPGERKTRIIKLLLPKRTSDRAKMILQSNWAEVILQIEAKTEAILQIEAKDEIARTDLMLVEFAVHPIPSYLKTLFKKVSGGVILGLTSALGWLIRGAMKGMWPPE